MHLHPTDRCHYVNIPTLVDDFVMLALDIFFILEEHTDDEDLLSRYIRKFDECILVFLADYHPGEDLCLLTTLPARGLPYSPLWDRLDEAVYSIFLADTEHRNAKHNDLRVENLIRICILPPKHAHALFGFFTNPDRSQEFMANNDMYASAALKCFRYFSRFKQTS